MLKKFRACPTLTFLRKKLDKIYTCLKKLRQNLDKFRTPHNLDKFSKHLDKFRTPRFTDGDLLRSKELVKPVNLLCSPGITPV